MKRKEIENIIERDPELIANYMAVKLPTESYAVVELKTKKFQYIDVKLAEKLYKVQNDRYHNAKAKYWAENQYGDAGDD